MSKSIWRLRNMACHLTFRQESRPCLLPPAPCPCTSLPLLPCCPLPTCCKLFGCGKHTVQLHLQLPQNKRCTLKTVRCTLHVARCTHTAHAPCRTLLSLLVDLAIALIIDQWQWSGEGGTGQQRIVATVQRVANDQSECECVAR